VIASAGVAVLLAATMAVLLGWSRSRSRRSAAEASTALGWRAIEFLRRPAVIGLIAGISTFAAVAAGFSGMPLWAQLSCGVLAAVAIAGSSWLQPPHDSQAHTAPLTTTSVQVAYAAGDLHLHPPPRRPVPPERAPAPPPGYVGRHTELRRALHALRRRPGSPPVLVVTGQPGVGKTAFALLVAQHLSRNAYPQLQLFVRLGEDHHQPSFPQQVRRSLLVRLGVPEAELGLDLDALRGRYRGELGDKPALVVVDDVAGGWQVEILKPPSGCAMIVVSTREQPGLLAHGAIPLRLAPLTTLQSLELLANRLGARRVARQALAALSIARACGGLPLALVNVAGNLAKASQRRRPLRDTAWLLRRERYRLRYLAIGAQGVQAALATNYALLSRDQQRTLQIIGLLDTAEVHAEVVAAALSTTTATVAPDQAVRVLGELVDAGLLEVASPSGDRWRRPAVQHGRWGQDLPGGKRHPRHPSHHSTTITNPQSGHARSQTKLGHPHILVADHCPAGTSRATTSTGTRWPARWITATVPSTPASSKASPITTRRSIRRSRAVDRGTAVLVISRLLRRPHRSHVSGPLPSGAAF
jgi:AAA ATPase domain